MNDAFIQMYLALGRADRTPEVEAALADILRAHPEYAVAVRRDTAFEESLASAMGNVPLPSGLHERLLKSAYARRGTALRRTAYRGFAIAAALLMAVGVGIGTHWRTRPTLDTDLLAQGGERERESPRDAVQAWLAEHDLPANLPLDFEYRWHAFHGKGELGKSELPVVVFQRGQEFARVYIVRDFTHDTRALKDAQSSLCKVTVMRAPGRPEITYVILHSTDTLDPFLRQNLGPLG